MGLQRDYLRVHVINIVLVIFPLMYGFIIVQVPKIAVEPLEYKVVLRDPKHYLYTSIDCCIIFIRPHRIWKRSSRVKSLELVGINNN